MWIYQLTLWIKDFSVSLQSILDSYLFILYHKFMKSCTCKICSKKFEVKNSAKGVYCSYECKYKDIKGKAPIHPNLIRKSIRNLARNALGNKCEICGYSSLTEVHFLIPKSKGGRVTPENLTILCPTHSLELKQKIITPEIILESRKKRR